MPSYTTSKEFTFIPALDVNEQLLCPGRKGCSIQPLKFVMNGSLLLGSKDSTNLRIQNTLGENVAVLFGLNYYEHEEGSLAKSQQLKDIVNFVLTTSNFGNLSNNSRMYFQQLLTAKDPDYIHADFDSYLKGQE